MKPIIFVEGLGKSYTIRHEDQMGYKSLREEIFKLPRNLLRREESREEFWALKDVGFAVMPGDRVGIIGRNGAGKSTLLKLLSRITEPTTGRITLRGRVASLLEVGTGFHPELTGRENIFLNGAILGMSHAEVRRKFDEIVDFSGVERFLDTPVKRYSSGMYVRLGFAVAAHLDPEVLIVDEVLAVGDIAFQKKCMGKMEEVSKEEGRTILFVSHNMNAISALCSTSLLMEQGKIAFYGDTIDCLCVYMQSLESKKGAVWHAEDECCFDKTVMIHRAAVVDAQGSIITRPLSANDEAFVEVEFTIYEINPSFKVGCILYTSDNLPLYTSFHTDIQGETHLEKGKNTLRTGIPVNILNDGKYFFEVVCGVHNVRWYFSPKHDSTPKLAFSVENVRSNPLWISVREGVLAPRVGWKLIH